MKILAVRPEPPDRSNTILRFDAELNGLRIFNIALKRTGSGYRVFAPSAFGGAVVTFTTEIAEALTALALGEIDHDRKAAA